MRTTLTFDQANKKESVIVPCENMLRRAGRLEAQSHAFKADKRTTTKQANRQPTVEAKEIAQLLACSYTLKN